MEIDQGKIEKTFFCLNIKRFSLLLVLISPQDFVILLYWQLKCYLSLQELKFNKNSEKIKLLNIENKLWPNKTGINFQKRFLIFKIKLELTQNFLQDIQKNVSADFKVKYCIPKMVEHLSRQKKVDKVMWKQLSFSDLINV